MERNLELENVKLRVEILEQKNTDLIQQINSLYQIISDLVMRIQIQENIEKLLLNKGILKKREIEKIELKCEIDYGSYWLDNLSRNNAISAEEKERFERNIRILKSRLEEIERLEKEEGIDDTEEDVGVDVENLAAEDNQFSN